MSVETTKYKHDRIVFIHIFLITYKILKKYVMKKEVFYDIGYLLKNENHFISYKNISFNQKRGKNEEFRLNCKYFQNKWSFFTAFLSKFIANLSFDFLSAVSGVSSDTSEIR